MYGIKSRASLFQSGNAALIYAQGTLKQGTLDTINSGFLDTANLGILDTVFLFQVAYFKGYRYCKSLF